ncbi:helix-turn-helix transcriptional regulator [Cystobacter fuscus]|uniref:helix-turn-helix transcriptional regulator n=1 Tax=Cystobacter fuscus TaxID=43 RepID=UPI002B2F44DF|nr:helix-turn-helix transcriptional regulator [Cystobacter fuscus]
MPETHPTQIKLARFLGAAAREARLRANMTQADVADRVNIATEVYGRIERGGMLPSLPTFRRLCRALRADANKLLGLDVSPAWEEAAGPPPADTLEEPISMSEDPPALRRLFRYLKKLTPEQIRAIGHVASTFLKKYERR